MTNGKNTESKDITVSSETDQDTFTCIKGDGTGEGSITFIVGCGEEVLKLDHSGDIYVRGRLAENDKEVVEAFKDFLRGVGYLP